MNSRDIYHIVNDVQLGRSIPLHSGYITNPSGETKVALRSFYFVYGVYNVVTRETVELGTPDGGTQAIRSVEPGYYDFDRLKEIIEDGGRAVTLTIDDAGYLTFSVVNENNIIAVVSPGLVRLLRLPVQANNAYNGGDYVSVEPVNLNPVDSVFVHLTQLSSLGACVDGNSTSLLAEVPIENTGLGDRNNVRFDSLDFKDLPLSGVSHLNIEVRNRYGEKLNNNGLPIHCGLVFRC